MMRTSASVLLANLLVLSTIEVNSLLGFSTAPSSRLAHNLHMVATMQPPVTIPHPTQLTVAKNDAAATNREKLPWSKSLNPDRDLTYMPMFQTQLDLMRSMGMEEVSLSESLVYRSSSVKPARIGNACFKNDKFRKVRLTYFDAGDNVQVFNSLWYPSFEYDIPLLGVDLISLGKSRVLSVIDFQPLHPTEEYSSKYISHLGGIRAKYPDLQGVLSGKIYDDTSFFSKNMLFGRFSDESKITDVVLPAFTEYLNEYVNLMSTATPDHSEESKRIVKDRQSSYDAYSALKDPAVGLFDAYFGKEWSASFVHDFLFSFSTKENTIPVAAPVHNFKINMATGAVGPASGHSTH